MGNDGPTMTDLLARVDRSGAPTGHPSGPPAWLTGAAAGLGSVAAGVVSCMSLAVLGWLAGEGGSMPGALRVGSSAWLLAHGGAITTAGAQLTLVPLGLTMVLLAVVWSAVRLAAGMSGVVGRRDVGVLAAATALSYAAGACAVALGTAAPDTSVASVRVTAISCLAAGAVAVLAAARSCGVDEMVLDRLPADMAPALRGAAAGVAALVGLSAMVLAVSLAVHVDVLHDMVQALNPGLVGGLLLVLACLLVLPNAVLFVAGVLLGPGLTLGAGTHVTLTDVQVGAVPAVPWLAAVPGPGEVPLWASALAGVPLVCGAVAGVLAVRSRPVDSYRCAGLRGGLAGSMAGAAVGGLVALSGGSIGPGRMAEVGPAAVACVAAAVAVLGVGGLVGGVCTRLLGRD